MPPIKRPTQESVEAAAKQPGEANGLPVLLKVEDVAKFLDVNLDTVRRMTRDGRLPAAKVGRRLKIRREDLMKYVETQFNVRAATRD